MRLIEKLGIVMVGALAVLAIVGAASASAVTLCKEEGNTSKECPAGKRYGARAFKAQIVGEVEILRFYKPEGGIEEQIGEERCASSTIEGKTTAESASPLPGEITAFSLSVCKFCKAVKALNLNYKFTIKSTGTGRSDGELIATSGPTGPARFEFTKCGSFENVRCVWGWVEGKMKFEFKGAIASPPAPAHLIAAAPLEYVEGTAESICGKTATFFADYKLVEPSEVWVTEKP